MTAVASPTAFQPLTRNAWSGNGSQTSLNMSNDDVSRLLPRKSAQRPSSSASNSSVVSSSSTITTTPNQNGTLTNGETNWATRKKPARGLWPSSKAEPVAGISTARTQPVATAGTGTSATSAISALHTPSSILQSQHMVQPQPQQGGAGRSQPPHDSPAILHLVPTNGTFERKAITVPYSPDFLRIGRQTNQKTLPTPQNGYFDSKVLSRQHAEIWAERDGKIWIRDIKSSNGTFVNGKRLSPENRDSDPHPIKEGDVLELGIDIVSEDQKTVVHHKVAARVEHAGLYGNLGNNGLDLNFGDLDPSAGPNGIGQPGSAAMRRTPSQASSASGARYGGGGHMQAPYHAKWLQPVSMEQVVKRLNTELRTARLQSQDLHHASSFINAVLTQEKPALPATSSQTQQSKPQSPIKDSTSQIKSRFSSSPPAPPPSQPLPEAPTEALIRNKLAELPSLQPILRRSDTERPKGAASSFSAGTSPIRTDNSHQILNLIEALSAAQKELSTQTEKLRVMEQELQQEREERSRAEERAMKLESGSATASQDVPSVEADTQKEVNAETSESAPSTLQSKLDLMRVEMDSMKSQMETYRQRAESAEQESTRDRKSLSEMVEAIQKRDEAIRRRKEKRRAAAKAAGKDLKEEEKDESEGDEELRQADEDVDEEVSRATDILRSTPPGILQKPSAGSLANGYTNPPSAAELRELGKAVSTAMAQHPGQRSKTQDQLAQTAPYASLIGVVLLGVGMMAWLNGWQKVVPER